MISVLVLVVVIIVVLAFVFANRLGATDAYEYPGSVGVGMTVIEFSKIDKICYIVSLLSVLTGVATGILLVWGRKESDLVWKLFGTSVIMFLGSILTLQLNRLMRGSRKNDSTKHK